MSSTQEKIEEILRSVQSMGYNQAISDSSDAHTESGAIYVDEALPQIETLINQARKEAAIEIRNLYGSPKCEALHHPKKYQHTALEDCPVEKEINALTEQSEESI